jgi:pyruvate dehydrogenase (quinone)
LFNGLMDARKEGAPIIAIAGDVESSIIDTSALEELNPYKFFEAASLYTARLVNPEQARAVISTAIRTAVLEKGPTVLAIPGDVASASAPDQPADFTIAAPAFVRPSDTDFEKLVRMIDEAKTVAIFGGDGCREGRDEVVELACKLKAPVGYAFRGKQWLEHENPNAVGMTGLIGYGGAYNAIHEADLLLMLGTDFPFSEFLPGASVKKVQIDKNPRHIGRRTALDFGLVGDIKSTVSALLPAVREKTDGKFLARQIAHTEAFHKLLQHYVEKGPAIKPIRPEFLAATLSELASDDAMFFCGHGYGLYLACETYLRWKKPQALWLILVGVYGQCCTERVRMCFGISRQTVHRVMRRWRLHDAGNGRSADADRTTNSRGSSHSKQREVRLRPYRTTGGRLHPVWSGVQESKFREGC